MPKELFIDPKEIRKSAIIQPKKIPLNGYSKTIKEIAQEYTREQLLSFYYDMRLIREFENMVQAVRTVKNYNGIEYTYTGPAHLSQGQEAAAVGQAYALDVHDYTFGTHRSHGEVIARCMAAIKRLPEDQLRNILENFQGALLWEKVNRLTLYPNNLRKQAEEFILYGFMTELFGREIGFTKGLGNSMHVFFSPFGVYPNNAIVGASAGIGTGAALYKRLMEEEGIVVVNVGDGAITTGHVWEALSFAAMEQFRTLWEPKYQGGLPILFNIMNNCYAMSGQTTGETTPFDVLARVGEAFREENLHAERVDGFNLFAVIDAIQRKKKLLLERKGPILLETLVYRHAGHSATDQNAYRSKEEMDAWQKEDPLLCYRYELEELNLADKKTLDVLEKEIQEEITRILSYAIDLNFSPRMDLQKDPDAIARCMFSNGYKRKLADKQPETIGKKEDNSRWKKIAQKERAVPPGMNPVSPLRLYTYRDAIFEALLDKFYEDPTMILFGEDVREHGNSFGVLQGLYESVPRHRLFNTPIAEGAIVSVGVGYAMCGGRAVPEIMWCDFLGRCSDELFNQLAKWQGMSGGILQMPCVVRVSIGAYYGTQHSQDWTSLVAHVPGLKIVYPATPYDAKGLLNAALAGTDPVLFFESQKLYDRGEQSHPDGVPKGYYEVPIGNCEVKRPGSSITILTIGPTLYPALEAAEELKRNWGWEAEVIDARTLVPFDYETVLASVRKTGRIVIVHDACERGGYGKTLAANIGEFAFNDLDAPPVSLGAHNWVSPCPELERFFFPSKDLILAAIHERIKPLPGFKPLLDASLQEKLRAEKLGI